MINDLINHEFEALKIFFAQGMSWARSQSAQQDAKLAGLKNPSNDFVEDLLTGPYSAHTLEQIIFRSVINELNALCEFALQNTWLTISQDPLLPEKVIVFAASRGQIEKALFKRGVVVTTWPRWNEVRKIKELSEGFKHRQRLQPFPAELQVKGATNRSSRLVDPTNAEPIADSNITSSMITAYLGAVGELLHWLRTEYTI